MNKLDKIQVGIQDQEYFLRHSHIMIKGFGFIEFVKSDDAVKFLDYVKENYKAIGTLKVPIAEFSIENSRAIKKKEDKINAKKERLDNTDVEI